MDNKEIYNITWSLQFCNQYQLPCKHRGLFFKYVHIEVYCFLRIQNNASLLAFFLKCVWIPYGLIKSDYSFPKCTGRSKACIACGQLIKNFPITGLWFMVQHYLLTCQTRNDMKAERIFAINNSLGTKVYQNRKFEI